MTPAASHTELLIATVARLLEGVRHVAVGASSPIPAAGAMLLRARNETAGRERVTISILGSETNNFFTNGGVELFDCAAQGRIDAFFLGGGEIDGGANINLVGLGPYPQSEVRWPGCFGSAFMYYLVPRVILFREEHSRRVLVERVEYISAPGASDGLVRPGGPYALLTGMALFAFDKAKRRFLLNSRHPGRTADEIQANTGFAYERPDAVPETPGPTAADLAILRGRVTEQLRESYPQFVERLRSERAAAS